MVWKLIKGEALIDSGRFEDDYDGKISGRISE